MKIRTRDVGLIAVGFVIGAVVAASLTRAPTRPPAAPASRVVATGPVLALASLPPGLIATNIQLQAPPFHIVLPPQLIDSFDSRSPLYPTAHRPVDLIETRYKADIKLDDLK